MVFSSGQENHKIQTFKEEDFSPNTKYDVTIDIGAQDLAGNALASAKRWSFTTKTTRMIPVL